MAQISREIRKFFLKDVDEQDRFLKGDRPTEEIFAKLFQSVGFIREKSDRAKVEEQGFVRLVNDDNAKNYINPTEDSSYAVQPSQLPDVASIPQDQQYAADQPPVAIDVVKDVEAQAQRATFFVKLKESFLEWLVDRILPSGGRFGQVLVKKSDEDFEVEWQSLQSDRISIKDITSTGIDYAYDYDGYDLYSSRIEGGRRGVLYLNNSFYNTWILAGNPDPRPTVGDPVALFRQIKVVGAKPGFRLKLLVSAVRSEINPNDPSMILRETELFQGNMDLNGYGKLNSGFRELEVRNGDTLTFILNPQGTKWILFEYQSANTSFESFQTFKNTAQGLIDIRDTFVQDNPISISITGTQDSWAGTEVTLPTDSEAAKVKIDFNGSVFGKGGDGNAIIRLIIDNAVVHEINTNVANGRYDNVSISWVGDINNSPFNPGQAYPILVQTELVTGQELQFENATLTVS